jgi:hypothetical protein
MDRSCRTEATAASGVSPVVTLTISEIVQCYWLAGHRITASDAQSLNHASTYKRGIRTRFDEESVGAIGEKAFAKWMNLYSTDPVNTFHRIPDCGDRFEVRSTSVRNGRLIVRDNDADDRIFVLALVALDGRVILRGWIRGVDAKHPQWVWNPNGSRQAWGVAQESLSPMDRLKEPHEWDR